MPAATGDEESAHVELPPKPTPQSDGSPYAETKEVAEVWYGGHHTLVVGYADPNNAAVSGAKKAVADDTNSVRRPHMGGGVRCARVRLMEYRGLVIYARVLSRFPCARFRRSTDRNTTHQHRAPTPHPYRRRRRRRSNH